MPLILLFITPGVEPAVLHCLIKLLSPTLTWHLFKRVLEKINRIVPDNLILQRLRDRFSVLFRKIDRLMPGWHSMQRLLAETLDWHDRKLLPTLPRKLSDADANAQHMMRSNIRSTGSAAAVELLYAMLENDDEEIRSGAAVVLALMDAPAAVQYSLNMRNSDDQEKRRGAIIVLSMSDHPTAIQYLFEMLDHDPDHDDEEKRKGAAFGLALSGHPAAEQYLIKMLDHDAEEKRTGAAFGLALRGNQVAVQYLLEMLDGDDEKKKGMPPLGLL